MIAGFLIEIILQVDTLQSAIEYIKVLEDMIQQRKETAMKNLQKQITKNKTKFEVECTNDSGYCDEIESCLEERISFEQNDLEQTRKYLQVSHLNEVSVDDVVNILPPIESKIPATVFAPPSPIFPANAYQHQMSPLPITSPGPQASTPIFGHGVFAFPSVTPQHMQNIQYSNFNQL